MTALVNLRLSLYEWEYLSLCDDSHSCNDLGLVWNLFLISVWSLLLTLRVNSIRGLGNLGETKKKEKMTGNEWKGVFKDEENHSSSKRLKKMKGNATKRRREKTWMEHRRINHQLWDSQDNSTTAYCVALQSISPRSKSVWPTVRALPAIACGSVIY